MINKKTSIYTFIFLWVLCFPFSLLFCMNDFVSSVIPGWHTTIYPFYYLGSFIKLLLLSLVIFGYLKLSKTQDKLSSKFFYSHFFLTLPSILFSKIPISFLIEFDTNTVKMTNQIVTIGYIRIILFLLFLIGQIMFFIYYYKTKKRLSN